MKTTFDVRKILPTSRGNVTYFSLLALGTYFPNIARLPYSIKILLECLLRHYDGSIVTDDDIARLAEWGKRQNNDREFGFFPSRVLLQDFTGVPAVVDLAAMRDAVMRFGGNPQKINPLIPVDLVIDHSIQVDAAGTSTALATNVEKEFVRNRERYEFLKWGQQAFQNFRVVPPAMGIVHQVNLEYLAQVVQQKTENGETVVFPDTLVGTDSHTTMVNGLGVVGWGVGGIEAEAAMLGQPLFMTAPDVIGVELQGMLREGVTATDLVLALTQMLRKHGVVEKFVEFCGSGLAALSLADRATIANMAPEYGATVGYFPIDQETLAYLRATGREEEQGVLVEDYAKAQGLFWSSDAPRPIFTETLIFDLAAVEPSIAGPKRPQDRVSLSHVQSSFQTLLTAPVKDQGYALGVSDITKEASFTLAGEKSVLRHGSVVIAAITSCTNTSNPSVMVAAGLLAKKAVERGLSVPLFVKTSLAPGSKTVKTYLEAAGLLESLQKLRFNIV